MSEFRSHIDKSQVSEEVTGNSTVAEGISETLFNVAGERASQARNEHPIPHIAPSDPSGTEESYQPRCVAAIGMTRSLHLRVASTGCFVA